jgi:hypothetical protein
MPRIQTTNLGGSLNQGRAPSELDPSEYSALSNFYQFGAKLRRRGGARRLTTSAFSERITGLASYRPDTPLVGGADMIVAGLTRWGIIVGSSISLIPNQAGFDITTSTRRWSQFQFKNIEYGIREGAGLVRSDGTYLGPAGIAAPSGAPVLAEGAAGSIPAADFIGVYTYYNANTGMESNPSPVSNTLTLSADKKINWTGITVSDNAQVTSRRLYRTLPDQTGEYFLMAEISNNVDTTYTGDNVLAQDLDRAVSSVNGEPPNGLLFGVPWKERLFASDGRVLYHSEDGLVEAFDPDVRIPFFEDDGHPMRGLHAFGDRLVVGKTNGMHYLVGSDPSTFQPLVLSDRHGCISHHSIQSAEGLLFWLGLDNVYRSDGNSVTGIASVKLRTIIENMDQEAARDAVATVYPTLGWYVLSIPGYTQLIYNYRTDVWATAPTEEDIQTFGEYYDDDNNQEIWVADDNGHVYRFNDPTYGYDDSAAALGNTITALADGRVFGAQDGMRNIVERVQLLAPQYAEDITLAIVSEGETLKSRTVSLDYEPRWKVYSLSTRHAAKSQSQLRITYTGATAIELEGYAIEGQPVMRPSMAAR